MPRRALVLGGGNAVGAYFAGAYEALHAAVQEPDWVAGSSVGAITAALIAGNSPPLRLERLRRWRERASAPNWLPPFARASQWAAAIESRLLGRPALFHTRMLGLRTASPEQASVYDTTPMRETLTALIDFDRLNGGDMRVSIKCTDLEGGEEVAFDTGQDRLGPEHLMASAALIPDLPPVRVGGRLLVDGGLASNTPAELALEEDLLAEVEGEGGRVAMVAQRHGLSESLLYNWRSATKAAVPPHGPEPTEFRPIGVIGRANEAPPALLVAPEPQLPKGEQREGRTSKIEIALPNGVRVKVGELVSEKALSRVLRAVQALV